MTLEEVKAKAADLLARQTALRTETETYAEELGTYCDDTEPESIGEDLHQTLLEILDTIDNARIDMTDAEDDLFKVEAYE